MKEHIYEAEQSWETQRRPVVVDHNHRQRHQHQPNHRQLNLGGGDDAAMDAHASSMSGMYEHLYSVASFCVYFKFNTKKKKHKNGQLFSMHYIHRCGGGSVVVTRHIYIYMS